MENIFGEESFSYVELDSFSNIASKSFSLFVKLTNEVSQLQKLILYKLYYEDYYLVDIDGNDEKNEELEECEHFQKSNIYKNVHLRVKILGNLNKKGKRAVYYIDIDKETGYLSCTCKDFFYRCLTKGLVCKHICFLVCKVMNIYSKDYFTSKKLDKYQIDYIMEKIKNTNTGIWKNEDISIKHINSQFKNKDKELDKMENCPICYNPFGEIDIVNCYDCKNYIHEKCMMIWINNGNRTCIYCRSKCWENYNNDFSQTIE